MHVTRGARALRHILQEQTDDLREVDFAGFRRWLDRHLVQWQEDAIFLQRVRIRELRRAEPRLRELEKDVRRTASADENTAEFVRLRQIEHELRGTGQAISGVSDALERADAKKAMELQRKLDAFRSQRDTLEAEHAELVEQSPPRRKLMRIQRELDRFRVAIGLVREEAHLARLLKERGRRSGRSGESFEQTALSLTEQWVLPGLMRIHRSEALARVRVLQGVTLGAARTEFDQVVIREPHQSGAPVEVLAAVEVKRNINDLAHGFRRRQENLAWLTGDAAHYDAKLYRTKQFRSGHFEGAAVHEQAGEQFLFTRQSFRLFRRDAQSHWFLDRFYFITRPGPVWGLSTAALRRIGFRVATDERWDLESEESLRALWRWSRSLTRPLETPDVLRAYLAAPKRGRQILLAAKS